MTKATLKHIRDNLAMAGINYEFGEWTDDLVYPYWVGEYQESPRMTEDGLCEATFILNGFSRGKYLDLENDKETIEKLFTYSTAILEDGTGVSIEYDRALIVPTGDAELKRMQINLSIKEWRVI